MVRLGGVCIGEGSWRGREWRERRRREGRGGCEQGVKMSWFWVGESTMFASDSKNTLDRLWFEWKM